VRKWSAVRESAARSFQVKRINRHAVAAWRVTLHATRKTFLPPKNRYSVR
jgi:hypothetical protein